MTLYFMTILLTLGVYWSAKISNNKAIMFLASIFVSFISSILVGFRDVSIGTDTFVYVDLLKTNRSILEWVQSGTEIGYALLIKLYQNFNVSQYSIFFFIVSFLTNLLVFRTIFKISPAISLSIVSFFTYSMFYISSFNTVRQDLAMAFFVYAIPFLINKNYTKYNILIAMACCFHISAIFLYFFPIIYKYVVSDLYKSMLVSFIVIVLYALFVNNILSMFISITAIDRYDYYLQSENKAIPFTTFLVSLFVYFALLICYQMFYKNESSNYLRFFIYLQSLSLSVLFSVVFLNLTIQGPARISMYFLVSNIFIFSFILKKFNAETKIIAYIFLIFIMILYFVISVQLGSLYGVFPYRFSTYLGEGL